jgi:hypothetical protein
LRGKAREKRARATVSAEVEPKRRKPALDASESRETLTADRRKPCHSLYI